MMILKGLNKERDDQRRIVLTQAQHLGRDHVGGDQAAAEDHGEEAEEGEEIAELEIRAVQCVGIQGTHGGAGQSTYYGDKHTVEEGPPDLGQLSEGIGKGCRAPLGRPEGVADLTDGLLGREGDDDNEDKRDDAAQGEQSDHDMDDCFRAGTDGI